MENNNPNAVKFHFTNSRFVPDDAAKGLFLFLVLQTVITLVYNVLYMVGLVQSIWSYLFTLILDFCFVSCVISIARQKKINVITNLKLSRAPSVKHVFICIAISVICLFGFSAVTNMFLELLYSMGYSSVTSDITIPNFETYLMYVGLICVAPAICEEILFRGLICNGLKRLGSVTAVLGSAFLFMIMHGSPDQTVHQFILGIILAVVFLVTNNLWVPIIIHFLNNFIAVTISYVAYGDSASETLVTEETINIGTYIQEYLLYTIVSAAIASILIYILIRALSRTQKDVEETEPVEIKSMTDVFQEDQFSIPQSSYYEASAEGLYAEGHEEKTEDAYVDPVFQLDENKMSSGGKAMLIISVAWLVIDWFSALLIGFSGLV